MDHSYSTERVRLQKSDHSYFTVGKKTPQVVLRKAQYLRELPAETQRSSIGQDHSYVRCDQTVHNVAIDCDGLDALIEAIGYRECEAAEVTADKQLQHSCSDMELVESPESIFTVNSLNENDDVDENSRTADVSDKTVTSCCRTDLDDLRSWISCIQLDHTYGSCVSLSSACGTHKHASLGHSNSSAICVDTNAAIHSSNKCPHNSGDSDEYSKGIIFDHAYESSSSSDRRPWDHAYNCRLTEDCLLDNSDCEIRRDELDTPRILNSHRTALSSDLDHAYFASRKLRSLSRWKKSRQTWRSSDDVYMPHDELPHSAVSVTMLYTSN